MNVSPELDARFRDAAVREGLTDVRFDVVASPIGELFARGDRPRSLPHLVHRRGPGRVARADVRRARARAPLDEVRRELDEYFEGRRHEFDLALDLRVAGFHADGAPRARPGPVRRDRHVRRSSPRRSAPARGPCGRHGDEPQPDPDRPAVPPHRRRERLADRLRGRAAREAGPARARGRRATAPLGRRSERR